jgi:hypothetical protein
LGWQTDFLLMGRRLSTMKVSIPFLPGFSRRRGRKVDTQLFAKRFNFFDNALVGPLQGAHQ